MFGLGAVVRRRRWEGGGRKAEEEYSRQQIQLLKSTIGSWTVMRRTGLTDMKGQMYVGRQ